MFKSIYKAIGLLFGIVSIAFAVTTVSNPYIVITGDGVTKTGYTYTITGGGGGAITPYSISPSTSLMAGNLYSGVKVSSSNMLPGDYNLSTSSMSVAQLNVIGDVGNIEGTNLAISTCSTILFSDGFRVSSRTFSEFVVTIPVVSSDTTAGGMNTMFNECSVGYNSVIDSYDIKFPIAATGSVNISTCTNANYPNFGEGTDYYYTNTTSTSDVSGLVVQQYDWVRVTAKVHTAGNRINCALRVRKQGNQ